MTKNGLFQQELIMEIMEKTQITGNKKNKNKKRYRNIMSRSYSTRTSGNGKINELNKRILDNAPISIITIDKKGYVTAANKYYFKLSNTNEFRDHNIFESKFFIRENLINDYKKLLANGTEVGKEKCYEKNSRGEDKYMRLIAVPLKDKNGNIEGALSMAVDITEAVTYRNKLKELNKDLEKKVAERTVALKEANKMLAKVLVSKVMFVSDLSHELRTSLSIVQCSTELISQGLASIAEDKEVFDQVFDEIRRMSAMLEDLTLLVKSDSLAHKLNYERINFSWLIASICKPLESVAQKKNIKIDYKNGKNEIEIMGDKSKLAKLVTNLISNGIRYNKENGWVKIWVESADNDIILKVEDNGIGISKEHLPRIFDRFYAVDREKSRNAGGSGLGLAICKSITESHGGSISVESKPGKGTLFMVRLPKDGRNGIKVK